MNSPSDSFEQGIVLRADVARKAGVSLAVVSRVLNDSGYVAAEKRERVLSAVRELEYKPNPVARSLKANRTNQLLFYVRDLSNNYYLDMYRGVAEVAAGAGFNVILSGHLDVKQIGTLMVDGVIFPFEDASSVDDLKKIRVPMVTASYNHAPVYIKTHVGVDLSAAVHTALEHLRSLGHGTIGFAAMEQDVAEARLVEFHRLRAGLPEADSPVFGPRSRGSDLTRLLREFNYFEAGIEAARQYLASDRRATAVLCFNDDVAIGFMSHLQSAGIRIPQDLSVMGFDNHSTSPYTSPPLTTMSLHPTEHGRECGHALIGLIEGGNEGRPRTLTTDLVIRQSTAPRN